MPTSTFYPPPPENSNVLHIRLSIPPPAIVQLFILSHSAFNILTTLGSDLKLSHKSCASFSGDSCFLSLPSTTSTPSGASDFPSSHPQTHQLLKPRTRLTRQPSNALKGDAVTILTAMRLECATKYLCTYLRATFVRSMLQTGQKQLRQCPELMSRTTISPWIAE